MIKTLKKYFIPNEENDYKPHILRKTAVVAIAVISVLIFFAGVFQNLIILKTDLLSAVIPRTLVDLANGSRFGSNLGALTISPTLEQAAQLKANDMALKSYFAHVSPDGVEPWHWFREAGYKYVYAGENLAVNFSDSVDVNNAWLNSPTHRANIMNDKFTEIGIATSKGFYKGRETIFVVQMFGRPVKAPTQLASASSPTTPTPEPIVVEPTQPTTAGVSVLGEDFENQEIFVSTVNTDLTEEEVSASLSESTPTVVDEQTSAPERVATSPQTFMNVLYILLGLFIFTSLLLTIFIEIRRQHPKHIIYGVGLLLLIVFLTYFYRTFIFTEVIIL